MEHIICHLFTHTHFPTHTCAYTHTHPHKSKWMSLHRTHKTQINFAEWKWTSHFKCNSLSIQQSWNPLIQICLKEWHVLVIFYLWLHVTWTITHKRTRLHPRVRWGRVGLSSVWRPSCGGVEVHVVGIGFEHLPLAHHGITNRLVQVGILVAHRRRQVHSKSVIGALICVLGVVEPAMLKETQNEIHHLHVYQ